MRTAYCVAGLGYGDEGKGATVDFICRSRQASLVIRYNGGPQAAHNVITPDGRHHTFAQFGSGTFVPGVQTYLSRFMLFNPISLQREEEHLKKLGITDAFDRLTVDYRCPVVTPFHRAVNRLDQKARGIKNSCGQGIGECRRDHLKYGNGVLLAGDLLSEKITKEKLRFLQRINCQKTNQSSEPLTVDDDAWAEVLTLADEGAVDWIWEQYKKREWTMALGGADRVLNRHETIVFEGAQGVLLDEKHGEEGFNTWTDTTFNNSYRILSGECNYQGQIVKIGCVRTYLTRHGDGPLKSETHAIDWSPRMLPELHNGNDGFQGAFRRGRFDIELVRHAIEICGGIDGLALNHLDCFPGFGTEFIETHLGTKILIEGRGPTARDRFWT